MLTGYNLELENGKNLKIAEGKISNLRRAELPAELFKKAQRGDEASFIKIYEYYKPYVEYLFFKHEGALIEGIDKEELAFMYKMGLINAIQIYDKRIYGYMRTCIAGACLSNLDYLRMKNLRKGRHLVSGIEQIGARFDFGAALAESSIWTMEDQAREDRDVKTKNYIDRFLSLLDERDRNWMLGYFKKQTVKEYAQYLGVSHQCCNQKLARIEGRLVAKKAHIDEIANAYYGDKKTVGQIAEEKELSRAEVCKAIRTHNYIYNGGDVPVSCGIESLIALCVLDYDEYGYYKISTEQPISRLKYAFKENYYKFITPAVRQVNKATGMVDVVAAIVEDGAYADDEMKKAYAKMTKEERSFYSALYAYTITGELKPTISDRVKQLLRGGSSRESSSR